MKHLARITALTLIVSTMTLSTQTAEAKPRRVCMGWRYGSDITPSTPAPRREKRMRALIGCVFRFVGISSQIPTAIYVADRESGLYPWAWNRSSDCRGLFQHRGRYWPGRVRAFLPPRFFPAWPRITALNARANTWVSAVMVRNGGWAPWS